MITPLRMPGGTLVTRLKVYDTFAPDGQRGGTPHVHLLCSELYYVLSGSGAVEVLDRDGFSRFELRPDDVFLFSPGTIHRLINPNGDLNLLVTMANSGLPERGDNIVTFAEDIMQNAARFADAMSASSVEKAAARRDRGVDGFLQLKAAFDQSDETGQKALSHFYEVAAALTAPHHAEWTRIIEQGALSEAHDSLKHAAALRMDNTSYLWESRHALITAGENTKPGFCGNLNRYFDPATLETYLPEGMVTR